MPLHVISVSLFLPVASQESFQPRAAHPQGYTDSMSSFIHGERRLRDTLSWTPLFSLQANKSVAACRMGKWGKHSQDSPVLTAATPLSLQVGTCVPLQSSFCYEHGPIKITVDSEIWRSSFSPSFVMKTPSNVIYNTTQKRQTPPLFLQQQRAFAFPLVRISISAEHLPVLLEGNEMTIFADSTSPSPCLPLHAACHELHM